MIVDADRMERNLATMARDVAKAGLALRPHAKTHNCTKISRLQLEHGAIGHCVGTLNMASALASAGIRDLFIASPLWPAGEKGAELRALHSACQLSVGIDSSQGAEMLAQTVAGGRSRLRVLVEIDSGERRSGVRPEGAVAVAQAARRRGLDVVGVFTHGGHSYRNPGARVQAARDEVETLSAAARMLADAGFEISVISAGSTPTARLSSVAPITEQRPGTYVFNDRQQVELGSATADDVSLVVAATVISRAVPCQVVLDSGAKTLAKDQPAWLQGFGTLLGYPGALITRLFDFHAVVTFPDSEALPQLGEVVGVVPNHACAVVNLARELVIARKGQLEATWKIDARG